MKSLKKRLEVVQQHVRTPSTWVEMACTYSTIDASLIPEIMVVVKCKKYCEWSLQGKVRKKDK